MTTASTFPSTCAVRQRPPRNDFHTQKCPAAKDRANSKESRNGKCISAPLGAQHQGRAWLYQAPHLPVTKLDFVAYGVSDRLVAPAIRELEALGFIRVTERGLGGNAEYRQPNLFFLTFAHGRNSRAEPPTHDWRKIKTVEEADAMAAAARARKNPNAVAIGSRNKNRNRLHKVKPAPATLGEAENPNPPATLSEATRLGYKVKPLSISWVGGTRTQLSPMCWAVPTHEVIDPRARAAIQHYWRPKLAGAHFSKKIRRETGVLQ
jgi:hypothetical protein